MPNKTCKRLLDILLILVAIPFLLPLLLMIPVAIKLDSRGPILFKAKRIGRKGKAFTMLKFRSMTVSQEECSHRITVFNDSRVTMVGRLLRKFKLDELPQLLNVLRGQMSIVGPRPEDPRYVDMYDREQKRILNYLPGLTSKSSVIFKAEEELLNTDDFERVYIERIMPEKIRIDVEFFENATLLREIGLIINTVFSLLIRR